MKKLRCVLKNNFNNSTKFRFSSAAEIKISHSEKKFFYPIKGLPKFENGLFTVFEYSESKLEKDEDGEYRKLPQVPYEIKEHSLKAFKLRDLKISQLFVFSWFFRFLTI